MKVGICIVLYDDLQHLTRLASALNALTHKNQSIYFLDNSTTGIHRTTMLALFPLANEVLGFQNFGFAAGNNLLAQKAIAEGCEAIWILNPDMAPMPDSLSELVKELVFNNKAAATGPIVCYGGTEDNPKIQLAGVKADFESQKKTNRAADTFLSSFDALEPFKTESLNGGSVLIRSQWASARNLFEEKYFMYNDEIDLMRRMHESNYEVMVCPRAIVFHYHDWSINNASGHCRMYFYMTRNKYLYWLKFGNYLQSVKELIKDIFLFPIIARFCYKMAGFRLIKFYYLGVLYGCLGKSGKVDLRF
jgi:GT2 family glycosyltransferase